MAVTTNLYPPVIDTYMPAFLQSTSCRVYFSLSIYNDLDEIENAQVTVRSQLTNLSVLDSSKYPSEIKLTNILTDLTRQSDDKYYIEIAATDIKDGFKNNQYYKVQIRFTKKGVSHSLNLPQQLDSWLTSNLENFSEWSTVCLIRAISIPTINLQTFATNIIPNVYATLGNISVIGNLTFSDTEETDSLKSYRIKLYHELTDTLLLDSGEQFSNEYVDINAINYDINYSIEENKDYYFTLEYTTNALYTQTLTYHFSCIPGTSTDYELNISVKQEEENGRVKIRITRDSNTTFTGKIIIRRASNKNNFTTWEDLYIQEVNNVKNIDLTWYDYTIENGIWYKYAIQGVNSNGVRASMNVASKNILALFEDIFLVGGNKQLKIKFDPSVSSFRRTLSESRAETIGSKYPFIRRNGNVDYSQFPIGGLIASDMDDNEILISKKEEYGDYYHKYENYNEEEKIPFNQIDFIWEKRFRDVVINFLHDDSVKLFRSPTEGNFLVKLMDISFTPNQTLGRQLWAFSSNAFEIDECNIDNFEKYNIYTRKMGS